MTDNTFCCYSSQRCPAAANTTPATSRKLFCLLYSHGTGSEKGFAPTIVSRSGSLKQEDRELWQPDRLMVTFLSHLQRGTLGLQNRSDYFKVETSIQAQLSSSLSSCICGFGAQFWFRFLRCSATHPQSLFDSEVSTPSSCRVLTRKRPWMTTEEVWLTLLHTLTLK
jgi:hypothetical protein